MKQRKPVKRLSNGRRAEIVNFEGADSPRSDPCRALCAHGFFGIDKKVVRDCQDAVEKTYGKEAHSYLVFHGRLDSTLEEIHEAIDYGVVKMNIDMKMQYAFTHAIADHMFKHYDSVLKVDGDVGSKKT